MESESGSRTNRAKELIEGGSEVAGAAVGGALGLLAGPPGAIGGAVGGVLVTRTLKRVADELRERLLSPRQAVRVGAAFAFALDEIRARLEQGDTLRSDGWVEPDDEGRPEAEELLEGVLLNAANAYEERKVQHLGCLYASLAFDDTIGRGYANFLLRLADRLTYRELASLALLASEENRQALILVDVARSEGDVRSGEAILAELADLGQVGAIGVLQDTGAVVAIQATYGGGDIRSFPLAKLAPTQVGADLHRLTRLDRIAQEDLAEVFIEIGGDAAQLPSAAS